MPEFNLERINELARKSRTPEGLTPEEKEEQAHLRKEYIKCFRQNVENHLENIVVVDADGVHTPLSKKGGIPLGFPTRPTDVLTFEGGKLVTEGEPMVTEMETHDRVEEIFETPETEGIDSYVNPAEVELD